MDVSDLGKEEQEMLAKAWVIARAEDQDPAVSFVLGWLVGMITQLLARIEK